MEATGQCQVPATLLFEIGSLTGLTLANQFRIPLARATSASSVLESEVLTTRLS